MSVLLRLLIRTRRSVGVSRKEMCSDLQRMSHALNAYYGLSQEPDVYLSAAQTGALMTIMKAAGKTVHKYYLLGAFSLLVMACLLPYSCCMCRRVSQCPPDGWQKEHEELEC